MHARRPFGIYEKALPSGTWSDLFASAKGAGFDFVEMSIDESASRLARLEWSRSQRREIARAASEQEIPIFSICLSAHRRFGLGSAEATTRARAHEILDNAIGLACDLDVRVVQIAGYYAYYESSDAFARQRYVDGLRAGTVLAEQRGVMLAIENIDTSDMASVGDCLALRDELGSPWFQIYPDVGNLIVNDLNAAAEVALLRGSAVGLHLKDARPGEPRRVPFGEGDVPFSQIFTEVQQGGYEGPMTIEMWNDDASTAQAAASAALRWVQAELAAAQPSKTKGV